MTINYQFGDVDANGALIRAQRRRWRQRIRPSSVMCLPPASFGAVPGRRPANSSSLGRNFQVIYEQANAHGSKVQTASSNMASTDSAVGSSWA